MSFTHRKNIYVLKISVYPYITHGCCCIEVRLAEKYNTLFPSQPGVTNAYINSDGNLVILDAQYKDATSFFCTATNKYGQDKDTLRVEVKGSDFRFTKHEINVL